MAHLKYYLNGTPGLKDGDEIDLSNFTVDGIMSNSHATYIANSGLKYYGGTLLPLCIRCDEGFKAKSVSFIGNGIARLLSFSGTLSFATAEQLNAALKTTCTRLQLQDNIALAGEVTDTNTMIFVAVGATSNDVSGAKADLFSLSFVEEAVS